MKKYLIFVVSALFLIQSAAIASEPSFIPPSHWTYRSLAALSDRGLIEQKIVPGRTALTSDNVVIMTIEAMNRAQSDSEKINEDSVTSMRQLVNGYKEDFTRCGYDVAKLYQDIDAFAMSAGLNAQAEAAESLPASIALSKKAADAVNNFTLKIYKASGSGNLFISPYSISSALSMTYAGARDKTASEMEKVLCVQPDIHKNMASLINSINPVPAGNATIITANAIWPAKQKKFLNEFIDTVRNGYHAEFNQLDYRASAEKARLAINSWVEKKTGGRIKDIIGKGILDANTPLVLTNAIYFKADWQSKFDAEDTYAEPFWVKPGQSVKTQMMHKESGSIGYTKAKGAEIAELPYRGKKLSMFIILPDKSTAISKLENSLTPNMLETWLSSVRKQRVDLTIPKFKMEQSFDLNKMLIQMGMPSAFDTSKANFSGMDGKLDLYIGNVLHKTFVEVSEKGTEAAAATAVVMRMTAVLNPQQPAVFKADRPFIFLIRDNTTGAILFIGRYAKP